MKTLVLLRHGQSTWNLENRFTGWKDVDLTEQGVKEARRSGQQMLQEGLEFDVTYTSLLKRAIRTLWLSMDEMDAMWLPVHRRWRLNERHYGALQGLDKAQTAAKHGEEQVKIWRRSYDIAPPPLALDDERHPSSDRRYAGLAADELPCSEHLADTVRRVQLVWDQEIAPDLRAGRRVLIVAHGNSLRALVKSLDGISDQDIVSLNIPTGMPLLYQLDDDLQPLSRRYLGDADEVAAAQRAVEQQGKAR